MGHHLEVKPTLNPESDTFFRWIHKRCLELNKNVIIPVVGATGSGKSYACLRIGERSNEILKRGDFDLRFCCRDLREFMIAITSKDLRDGEVVILEETGINIHSRNWMTRLNKIINYIFQSFRDMNLTILLNLPDPKMLDSDLRKLIHGKMVMDGIDYKNKQAKVKFKVRQRNYDIEKDYWKYLRAMVNGRIQKIQRCSFNKPSDELCEAYERHRKEYNISLRDRIKDEVLMRTEQEAIKQLGGNGRNFTEKQQEIHDLWHGGIKKWIDIASKLGVKPSVISQQASFMDRKYPKWRVSPRI